MNSKIVKTIQESGGDVFLVGGAVRDSFLGITDVKDQDFIVTGVPLEDLTNLLEQFGQVNLVGKSFGVLKFKLHGSSEDFDIALPRTERSTGEGHKDFEVNFDHNLPIEDDLGRRDFTFNAIAIKLGEDDEIIDPFNGREDLKNKVIRQVFPKAFEEDPLRMLRAVQFAARFKFSIEAKTIESIRKNAEKIKTVSGERIFEEFKKIMLRAEFPSIAFKLMHKTGLLKFVFPELENTVGVSQPAKFHDLDVFNHILHAVDSVLSTKLHVRLAALFHDIAKPQTRSEEKGVIHFLHHEHAAVPIINDVLNRLGAPNELIDQVKRLVKNHMFAADFDMTRRAIRRLINRVGEDLIHDLITLRVGDRIASGKAFLSMGRIGRLIEIVDEELADPIFSVKNLKVNGHDLKEAGFKPGPIFKQILHDLLEKVMEDPELNEKEKLLEIINKEWREAGD